MEKLFFSEEERKKFYPDYIQKRTYSTLRLLCGNLAFLISSILFSIYAKIDPILRSSFISHVCNWLIITIVSVRFFLLPIIFPRRLINKFGLEKHNAYDQLIILNIILRGYSLMLLVLQVAGVGRNGNDICQKEYDNIIIYVAVVDIMQVFVWSSLYMRFPFGLMFLSFELASLLIRLYSCRQDMNKDLFALLLESIFCFFIILMGISFLNEVGYKLYFTSVGAISNNLLQRVLVMNTIKNDINLSLHRVMGSIFLIKSAGIDQGGYESLSKSVQQVAVLVDDIMLLTRIEEGRFLENTIKISNLRQLFKDYGFEPKAGIIMKDIHEKREAKEIVPNFKLNIHSSGVNILLDGSHLNMIMNNVMLYLTTAIRFRAMRDRKSYSHPLVTITARVCTSKNNRSVRSEIGDRQYSRLKMINRVIRFFSELIYSEQFSDAPKQSVLRITFDHNGEFAASHHDRDNGNSSVDSSRSQLFSFLSRKNAYSPTDSGMLDGSEVFLGINSNHAYNAEFNDTKARRDEPGNAYCGRVFRAHVVPVQSCISVFHANVVEGQSKIVKPSPLFLTAPSAILEACGGQFTVFDYYTEDRDREKEFSRLLVDIPCTNPLEIDHSEDSASMSISLTLDTSPLLKSTPVKSSAKSFYRKIQKMKIAIFMNDIRLLAYSKVAFTSLKASGSIDFDVCFQHILKPHEFSENLREKSISEFDIICFDDITIGRQLRGVGFIGTRLFFCGSASYHDSIPGQHDYEFIMSVPFTTSQIRLLLIKIRRVINETIFLNSVKDEKNNLVDKRRKRVNTFWFSSFFSFSAKYLKSYQRFVAVYYILKVAILRTIDFIFWLTFYKIDAFFSPSPVPSLSNRIQNSPYKPNFLGKSYEFCNYLWGMPTFDSNTEGHYLIWKCFSENGGLLSHSSVLTASFVLFALTAIELIPLLRLDFIFVCLTVMVFARYSCKTSMHRLLYLQLISYIELVIHIVQVALALSIEFPGRAVTWEEFLPLKLGSGYTGGYVILIQLLIPTKMILSPYLCYPSPWIITLITMMVWVAETLILTIRMSPIFVNRIMYQMIVAAELFVLFATFIRIYESEYRLRLEFQNINWVRYQKHFFDVNLKLGWAEMAHPLKLILKQKWSVVEDLMSNIIQGKIVAKEKNFDEIYLNFKTLIRGFLSLEATYTCQYFTDLVENDDSIELRDEFFYLYEECLFLSCMLEASNIEMSVMIHPSLARVRFDKQIFRMLLVDAISQGIKNIEKGRHASKENEKRFKSQQGQSYDSSNDEFESYNIQHTVGDNKFSKQYSSHYHHSDSINEILIQVGVSTLTNNPEEIAEFELFYPYLRQVNGNCDVQRSSGKVSEYEDRSHQLTVAIVDDGLFDDSIQYDEILNNQRRVCRTVVRKLNGIYETETKHIDSFQKYRNITRYTLPYVPVAERRPFSSEVSVSDNRSKEKRLWKTAMQYPYCGFERSRSYYDLLKDIFIKRFAPLDKEDPISNNSDIGEDSIYRRRIIIVHSNSLIGETYVSAFAMHKWHCQILPSASAVIASSELCRCDVIAVCYSSQMSATDSELILPESLSLQGFNGILMGITDAALPNDCVLRSYFKLNIDIPILDSSVKIVNVAADSALLEYMLGSRVLK